MNNKIEITREMMGDLANELPRLERLGFFSEDKTYYCEENENPVLLNLIDANTGLLILFLPKFLIDNIQKKRMPTMSD